MKNVLERSTISCQKLDTPFLPHSSLLPSFHSTHLLFRSQFPSEVKCLPNLPSFHPSIHSFSIPFKREGLPEHIPNIPLIPFYTRVSIPFKREGLPEPARMTARFFAIFVSIPFKREGLPELQQL